MLMSIWVWTMSLDWFDAERNARVAGFWTVRSQLLTFTRVWSDHSQHSASSICRLQGLHLAHPSHAPRLTRSQAFLPVTWDLSKLGGRNSNMLKQRLGFMGASRPKDVTFHSWNQALQRASTGIPGDLGTCVESLERTTTRKLNGWNPRMVAKFLWFLSAHDFSIGST